MPIYQTTSYVFKDCASASARFELKEEGNIYGRLSNPHTRSIGKRISALENGKSAPLCGVRWAAITYTILNIATSGSHIVAANTIYGGTYNLLDNTLPAYGISATFVDPSSIENFESDMPKYKAIFIETLGNPNSNIIDIEAVADIAHRHGLPLIVDNTFGTPYLFRPIEHGAYPGYVEW